MSGSAYRLRRWLARLLVTLRVVGHHSRFFQQLAWSKYDWSTQGEEWTFSEAWKQAVIERAIAPYVRPDSHVLEIGPGAGRWTAVLLDRAAHVTAVDVTAECVEQCRARFAGNEKLSVILNNGASLRKIGAQSVDVIWSFDVFVHLSAAAIEQYVGQFPRILKPGGLAVIHHARAGAYAPGWRSNVTIEDVRRSARSAGLQVVEEIESLEGNHRLYAYAADCPDVISVLRVRPA